MFWRCQLAPPPLQARTPRGCARGAGAWCMQIVGGKDPAQRDGSAAVRARWHAWHSLPGDPADGGGGPAAADVPGARAREARRWRAAPSRPRLARQPRGRRCTERCPSRIAPGSALARRT
ncbi:unnamed protein product [Prorocentrum cordatum]|uniref:Uncharacterized protein n=1 Tax=Prorocentrum cordatum TaxID=2364126 RepID=A0ABN9X3W9_9DINO|nr:unnamed protein product [Polarella glacialis]